MKIKNWFIPSLRNRYSPYLIQKVAMLGMLILVLLSFALVNIQALFWQTSDWLVGAVLPAVVVDLTNSQRADQAALPLKRNALLDQAAQLKAEHMAKNKYFAHYSPEGVSPWYWFEQVGYTYAHAGENLAVHFNDSDAVVEAWMDSPSHKANIINNNYTEIGVGTAKGRFDGFDTVFVVQLFGAPAQAVTVQPPVVTAATPAPVLQVPEEKALALEETVESVPVKMATKEPVVEVASVDTVPVLADFDARPEAEVLSESVEAEVVSSYIATSSGLPVASTDIAGLSEEVSYATWWQGLATSPNRSLQLVYLTVGMLVALMLLASVVVSVYHGRAAQVVYGVALLIVMAGLFFLHISLTGEVQLALASAL